MLPITDAKLLAALIIGSAFETIALDALITEFGSLIMKEDAAGASEAEIIVKLEKILEGRNQRILSMDSNLVYKEPPGAEANIKVWMEAETTAAGRDELLGVCYPT